MSFGYNFDVDNHVVDLLPPDKRYKENIGIIRALLSGVKWAHSMFFKSYYEGTTASQYAPGMYNYLDEVIYQKKVYCSLIPNNSDLPTTSNWVLVQENFIGVKERVLYNGSKIVLEYALNKEFGGVFRQPSTPSGIGDVKSDIYITKIPAIPNGFFVGKTEPNCSSVGQSHSSSTIGSTLPSVYNYHFRINIPSSLYVLTNDQAISNFTKLYLPTSLKFLIQSY